VGKRRGDVGAVEKVLSVGAGIRGGTPPAGFGPST
jgi:hypothetical protein